MSETKTLKTLVLDVGELRKREIKQLKQGLGPISDQARVAAADTAVTTTAVVPILIVYEKRPKKRRGLLSGLLRKR